jgi:hypothetical protein
MVTTLLSVNILWVLEVHINVITGISVHITESKIKKS